ncbi:hypothetical protein D3C76_1088660 [compost metagenome]
MDVRGVLLDRLAEDGVDQADDRRVVLLFQQVLGFRDLLGQGGEIQAAAQILGQLHGGGRIMLVSLGEGLLEGIGAQGPQRQAAPGEAPRLGQRHQLDAGTVGQAGLQAIQQQYAMPLGEAEGQATQGSINEWGVHPRVPVSGGSRRKYCSAIRRLRTASSDFLCCL